MKYLNRYTTIALLGGTLLSTAYSITETDSLSHKNIEDQSALPLVSSKNIDGKFTNYKEFNLFELGKAFGMLKRWVFEKKINSVPSIELPIKKQKVSDLTPILHGDVELTRLGHSSILIRNSNAVWLIDPVFSERASPVQWAGPKRFHPVPLDYTNLTDIEGIIISHNHYDHLDEGTIKAIHEKVSYFAVPLGIGEILIDWGVDPQKINEFDWWENRQLGSMNITAAPAQHFSGRGLFDSMETLWCGWALHTGSANIYYTGDGGYFETFKQIGKTLGPFDIAIVETGAYDPQWPDVHMKPTESIQAAIDLGAKAILPVHNGTFDLAFHSWDDPFKQITALGKERKTPVFTPIMGEPFLLNQQVVTSQWWSDSGAVVQNSITD
ncbi:MAG: MBL fold metallo-hydrolase [Fibrobacterales bacterium]